MIIIKNDKYGSMYVPKALFAPKEGKKPEGENALDRLREDIERIKDENIKRNRDNLDAMYNIDMRNMSPSMKRLFSHYSSEIADAKAEISAITSEDGAVAKMLAEFRTEVDGKISTAVAGVEATANKLQASVDIVAKYDSRLSAVETKASENENSVTLLVESIGEDGGKLSASIQTAIKEDESFIKAVADVIDLTGYVTFNNLKNEGESVIDGNNISLILDGKYDDGIDSITGSSYLTYEYNDPNYTSNSVMAYIRANANGEDTETTSRYALEINTNCFYNKVSDKVYPAIKLYAVGGMSFESEKAMYLYTEQYMTLKATYGTRIRAIGTYQNMVIYGYGASINDYVFATDGIFYNGIRIVDTSKEV